MPDRFRLVRAVNAGERRAEIEGPRAKRVFDAAGHVARQLGPTCPPFSRRGTAVPFPFRGDVMGSGPVEAVTADADAVAQRLAISQDQIKPTLRCRDVAEARRQ